MLLSKATFHRKKPRCDAKKARSVRICDRKKEKKKMVTWFMEDICKKPMSEFVELALPGRVAPCRKEMLVKRPGESLVWALVHASVRRIDCIFTVPWKDDLQVMSSPPLAGLN